jgi:hypothetical protein
MGELILMQHTLSQKLTQRFLQSNSNYILSLESKAEIDIYV